MRPQHPLAENYIPALFAAIGAAGLFIGITSLGLSLVFLFVPALPLLMLSMRAPAQSLLASIALACLFIAAGTDTNTAVFFLFYLGLPISLFATRLPRSSIIVLPPAAPMGMLLTDLCIYGALVFTGIELHLADQGGIQGALLSSIRSSTQTMDAQLQASLIGFIESNAFFMLGVGVWWWVLLMYAHSWIAARFLQWQGIKSLPSLALMPFNLPIWMLALLVLCSAGSFIEGTQGFIARVLFIIFLLPYYLLGVSFVRLRMQNWPNRTLWLTLMYVVSLLYAVPVFIVAVMGVWQQCKAFSLTKGK